MLVTETTSLFSIFFPLVNWSDSLYALRDDVLCLFRRGRKADESDGDAILEGDYVAIFLLFP